MRKRGRWLPSAIVDGVAPDPTLLVDGIEAWLRATRPASGATVISVERPTAGLTNDTLIVRCVAERLVLRLAPAKATFPEIDLGLQARLHRDLADAGIPTPVPVVHEADRAWLGAPFLAMPFVDGHIPSQLTVLDPWLAEASVEDQSTVQHGFIGLLAQLHRLDPVKLPVGQHLRGGHGLDDEVTWWHRYARWAADGGEPPMRLTGLLDWCATTCPANESRPSLLWGDARLENVIFDKSRRIAAVLDWETASLGPAELDLAWYLAMDRIQSHFLGGGVLPGFADRHELVNRYEGALGRPTQDLAWHQVFAAVRALAVTFRQAAIADQAGEPYPVPGGDDNPMFDVVESWLEADDC